jgi:hypothetical protein
MKLHHVHSPATVGDLKKLIEQLPDGMELRSLNRGELMHINMSLQLRGAGTGSKKNRTVSRGGVEFLAVHDF